MDRFVKENFAERRGLPTPTRLQGCRRGGVYPRPEPSALRSEPRRLRGPGHGRLTQCAPLRCLRPTGVHPTGRLGTGGHKALPYGHACKVAVGAACMAARTRWCFLSWPWWLRGGLDAAGCGHPAPDCRKTSLKMSVTEQRGKCEGGKKPPSRSIDTYF